MGFYNFFYHLKHLLRRMPKKILVTIIIILLLFIFSTQSHAVDHVIVDNTSNVDAFNYFQKTYDRNWGIFLNRAIIDARKHNNTFNSKVKNFCAVVNQGSLARVWYLDMSNCADTFLNSSNQSFITDRNSFCFGYSLFQNENQRQESFLYAYSSYSSTANNSRRVLSSIYTTNATAHYIKDNSYVYTDFQSPIHLNIPDGLERYVPYQYVSIVSDIANDSFDFETTNNILTQIETNTDQANQELNDMNNFIQDDTVDEYTQNDLPQSNFTDPTESTFNGIFNRLYSAVSNDSYHSVTIPLKFGQWDKSFSLNSNSLDFMRGDRNRDLVAFIELIWSFIIYYYILRDIYNMVNDLSQGKIADKVDNIKTQLL